MHNRFAAAVVALALLVSTSPVAARTIFQAFGGPGDRAFDDHCPAHEFLVGLAGRAGKWIDQIQIICSPILPNGTHGTKYYGPLHGGGGGTTVEYSCPANSVVLGAAISITDVQHPRVSEVVLRCVTMQLNGPTSVTFGGTPDELGNSTEQRCTDGEVGSGFNGHYGQDVNALGLDCAVRIR